MDGFEIDRGIGQPKATLPYAKADLELDDAIIVHVSVLSQDMREVQEVTRAVMRQLSGLRVNDRPIAALVSAQNVEVSVAKMRQIAAMVTPFVCDALGIQFQK